MSNAKFQITNGVQMTNFKHLVFNFNNWTFLAFGF